VVQELAIKLSRRLKNFYAIGADSKWKVNELKVASVVSEDDYWQLATVLDFRSFAVGGAA
jgi:hypothetical protein